MQTIFSIPLPQISEISWWETCKQSRTVKRFGVWTLRNVYNGWTELHPNRLTNWMDRIRTLFSVWGFHRAKVQGCTQPNTGQQQFFDCTTWPCLTHALRPTHSLRSCCGNVVFWGVVMDHAEKVFGKDYWQNKSETYSINSSSVETTRVEFENS